MKNIFIFSLLVIFALSNFTAYLNSQPVDCNGEHTYCPISKQYPYHYCEGGTIVIKCAHRPGWQSGTPLRAPYPICIDFIDDSDAPSTFCMPDKYGVPQTIFNKVYCFSEADAASYDWNCLCDVQGQACQCYIQIVFSLDKRDFKDASNSVMETQRWVDPVGCSINCLNSKIYVNITPDFLRNNHYFTYNEAYQSAISNLDTSYKAYNFREMIQHELGHVLGLLDYSSGGYDKQRCPPGNGGIMNEFGLANAYRQDFSNDDKCYFKNLYCGSYTTKVEELENKSESAEDVTVMPNPFVFTTNFVFNIDKDNSLVELNITDILGSINKKLISANLNSGKQTIQINSSDLPSGVYGYRLTINNVKYTGMLIISR